MSKHVVSSTLGEPSWANTTVLRGRPVDEVRRIKAQPGADVVCTGSMTLLPALLAAGILDELRLFVHPVVLGRGRRLFEDAPRLARFDLVEIRAFSSGVALLRHLAQPVA